jgi:tetratricopeptide (TPR) repeat protein
VVNGATEKRAEAIRILRQTKESNPTDTYSRNQLAVALAASRDPEELKEAIGILEETIENDFTNNKYSRELLAKLTGEAPGPLQGAEPPLSGTRSDETEGALGAVDLSAQVQQPLPAELSNLARMRRLRFRLTHSQGANKDAALNELRETLETDSTFAYAQLLAVRQRIWKKDSDTLPSFPAAFELALQDEDAVALARLAKQCPRLEALTLVARAIFGDADAARLVRPTLDSPGQAKAGIEKMLRKRVGPILRVIEGGRLATASLQRLRERAIAEVSEINEWAMGGGDWRVASNF